MSSIPKKIKVFIIDDSALIRQVLTEILESDPAIKVIGSASDPFIAAKKLKAEAPDVITLDIEMPRMDGLTFLKKLMAQHPLPVVIISSLSAKGTHTALKALELGAVEIYNKPLINSREAFTKVSIELCDLVKAAAKTATPRKKPYQTSFKVEPVYSADQVFSKSITDRSMIKTTEKIVAVGASTGGTEALKQFLTDMPYDSPGILITQHMPEKFTKAFAERLNQLCKITVKEAENGDQVIRGRALIAPGSHHMVLNRSGARYFVQLLEGPLVNRHRPSVDVLFRSTATYAGKNSVGILMTGMGKDGAKGLLEMKEAGAFTIAQDEKSSVVFGMPKEAIQLGAAMKVLPLKDMAKFILRIT